MRSSPRTGRTTTFANEGRAGSAGKANHLEAEAVQRLAEEVLAGEHGTIGFTVNLAEGQSWPKVLARRGLVEHARPRLVRAIQGIVAEALEKREMDMGAQTATIETDEIARLQAQLETAKAGELLLLFTIIQKFALWSRKFSCTLGYLLVQKYIDST